MCLLLSVAATCWSPTRLIARPVAAPQYVSRPMVISVLATAAPAPVSAAHAAAEPPSIGPVEATLELLEWSRLSAQVASFASTTGGRESLSSGLELPGSLEESEVLLRETGEAHTLEQVLASPIDLRGFRDLQPLVSLASKGGVLSGEQLASITGSLVTAAAAIKKLKAMQGGAEAGDAHTLSALPALFDGIPVQAELRRAIADAIDDSGTVRDTAAPTLGDLRFAIRGLATAARSEANRIIQLKADALATRSVSLRDDRYVLQVWAALHICTPLAQWRRRAQR